MLPQTHLQVPCLVWFTTIAYGIATRFRNKSFCLSLGFSANFTLPSLESNIKGGRQVKFNLHSIFCYSGAWPSYLMDLLRLRLGGVEEHPINVKSSNWRQGPTVAWIRTQVVRVVSQATLMTELSQYPHWHHTCRQTWRHKSREKSFIVHFDKLIQAHTYWTDWGLHSFCSKECIFFHIFRQWLHPYSSLPRSGRLWYKYSHT